MAKHEWLRDRNGDIALRPLGGLHDGPVCLRCGAEYCHHCVKVGVVGDGRTLDEILNEVCTPTSAP